jgi:hypothetical protein
MPALSAKERGLLVLGCLKDGTPEDPAWRQTMPANQVREFNHFIDLMNVANIQLAAQIAVLEQAADNRDAGMLALLRCAVAGAPRRDPQGRAGGDARSETAHAAGRSPRLEAARGLRPGRRGTFAS